MYDFTGTDLTTLAAGTQFIVLSHSGLAAMKFEDSGEWSWGSGTDIYDWLNGTFYNSAFTTEEQGYIDSHDDTETSAPYTNISTSTNPYVWLLSYTEASTWLTTSERICSSYTAYSEATGAYTYNSACYWWLRSCGSDNNCAYHGDCGGILADYLVDSTDDVARPALVINL